MDLLKTVQLGNTANTISKVITGTDEVTPGRTVVATGTGALLGTVAVEGVVLTASTLGFTAVAAAAAPIAIPLAVGVAIFAGIRSLFD